MRLPKLCARASVSILYGLLQDCINQNDLCFARRIHSLIISNGFETHNLLAYHLIIMFASFGKLQEANEVFQRLPRPSTHAWAAIISAHLRQAQAEQVLHLYFQMAQSKGNMKPKPKPNIQIFLAAIKACASMNDLTRGRLIHTDVLDHGQGSSVYVTSSLIHMYAKCGSLNEARVIFDSICNPDVVVWTSMIAAYAMQSCHKDALELFQKMQQDGVRPTIITFVTSLKACATLGDLEKGKKIHEQITDCGLDSVIVVANSLINMYTSCGQVDESCKLFNMMPQRDVISWTAIIQGYAQHGLFLNALHQFTQMQLEGVEPNRVTFLWILKACTGLEELELGRVMHTGMVKCGVKVDAVMGSTLVDMYARCGCIAEAIKVFEELPHHNVVSWTAIISACAQQGLGKQALEYFHLMQQYGICPNNVTFLSALRACKSLAALNHGKSIHNQIKEYGLEFILPIANALIDMYAGCAELKEALKLFNRMPQRDVVSWTAMIGGYAQQGFAREAFNLFNLMQQEGLKPNKVTYLSMLTACGHDGLMSKAMELFRSMSELHSITPEIEHYVCMVDVLARDGRFYEAEKFINMMPLKPNAATWMSVLGACQVRGNVELGRRCFDLIVNLEPKNKAAHVLMSSIYAASHQWSDKVDIEWRLKSLI